MNNPELIINNKGRILSFNLDKLMPIRDFVNQLRKYKIIKHWELMDDSGKTYKITFK